VKSYLTQKFIDRYRKLPKEIREQARQAYRLWKEDHYHPSLHFKRIKNRAQTYSVRVGDGWRALGLVENDEIYWYWIGSHADYDKLL
jgi:mRNA-degrading endonuclease RelE of RelBE toxin-antitoxin system